MEGYGSRSTSRSRRTKAEMQGIRDALYAIVAEIRPCTVRQVFYQAVSRGVVGKTEAEYKGTVVRLLGDMRREGDLPWSWLADNTRWMRKPSSWATLEDWANQQTRFFRRALWANQADYVEVWLEKDALSGVLWPVTAEWDVPLMVTRGYPSLTFLHAAAEAIAAKEKPTTIYYLGDHDPSGVDIPRKVEEDLLGFLVELDFCDEDGERQVCRVCYRADCTDFGHGDTMDFWVPFFTFERLAVLPPQIEEMNLPTRPTKRTDTRSKNFEGESVELDAVHPATLRQMVADAIFEHIDEDELARHETIEAAQRETLSLLPGLVRESS